MSDGPKILTLDIETSPTLAWVWGQRKQNIYLDQIVQPTRVICFAAKWHHKPNVMFRSEFHDGSTEMIEFAHFLLDRADAVVTYNGDSFDIPHLNREFAERKLTPPSPFKSIDLYKVARKNMRFFSHKLQHITERLELTGKLQNNGLELWLECMAGNPKKWAEMRRYNKRDVVTTEEFYDEAIPWLGQGFNQALYVDAVDGELVCPKCGVAGRLQKRGFRYTAVSKFQRYYCSACGGWPSEGKRVAGVDLR